MELQQLEQKLEDDFRARRSEYEFLKEEMSGRLNSYHKDKSARDEFVSQQDELRARVEAHLKQDYS